MDVLDSALYVRGAVHVGEPKSDDARSFDQLGTYFKSRQLPADLGFLHRLGRVVLRGLEPLRAQVIREQGCYGSEIPGIVTGRVLVTRWALDHGHPGAWSVPPNGPLPPPEPRAPGTPACPAPGGR
jgi:hypothetical protein